MKAAGAKNKRTKQIGPLKDLDRDVGREGLFRAGFAEGWRVVGELAHVNAAALVGAPRGTEAGAFVGGFDGDAGGEAIDLSEWRIEGDFVGANAIAGFCAAGSELHETTGVKIAAELGAIQRHGDGGRVDADDFAPG